MLCRVHAAIKKHFYPILFQLLIFDWFLHSTFVRKALLHAMFEHPCYFSQLLNRIINTFPYVNNAPCKSGSVRVCYKDRIAFIMPTCAIPLPGRESCTFCSCMPYSIDHRPSIPPTPGRCNLGFRHKFIRFATHHVQGWEKNESGIKIVIVLAKRRGDRKRNELSSLKSSYLSTAYSRRSNSIMFSLSPAAMAFETSEDKGPPLG